ncbi:MAG: hypothetical protein V3W41_00385 [Planctomycetota bacterium]
MQLTTAPFRMLLLGLTMLGLASSALGQERRATEAKPAEGPRSLKRSTHARSMDYKGKVRWAKNLDAARKRAEELGRPVLLVFDVRFMGDSDSPFV